ncbi:flavin reductase family protein [Gordonia hydrophobica]|uniref:Flavin reductase family protein n=1 Tax=Gordonia hydrophobica TaxID=40516 RepID=A0ABZ2U642_9ACTN|nr:flavin reductase family protein [Gordonia hydrophobica]MBM7367928.1 flavin reductase (DIM6/NTAB) family NADH-FMN oxidoreductase RutF [Gordonia hydrophobica]
MQRTLPRPGRQSADVSADDLRNVMGHFATGVAIITARDGDEPVGLTCQSVVSVSLEPPLIAFCPAKSSSSWPRLRNSGDVCINVLSGPQGRLCRQFSRSGTDKFAGVAHSPAGNGAPVIHEALAHVEATVDAEHDAGDHTIVVCRVTDLVIGSVDHGPLLFYRGGFGNFH